MSAGSGAGPPQRLAMAAVLSLSLAAHALVALAEARGVGLPLSHLGAYGDGHLYLEIAKSFPVPFSPEGRYYLGQAPAYPALVYGLRLLLPDALVNWGLAALLAAWLPAGLATALFYAAARELGLRPLAPALVFAVGHPTWFHLAANPNSEPLAICLALAALLAFQRHRAVLCWALLAGAVLGRYPAVLLTLPFAFGALVLRRERRPGHLALVALPAAALALVNLYHWVRVPDFRGVFQAHQFFWRTHPTWPFAEFARAAGQFSLPGDPLTLSLVALTWGTLIFYGVAAVVGLASRDGVSRLLGVWVAVIVLFHVSLSGSTAVWAFARLSILAWPAALLVLWRAGAGRAPMLLAAPLCLAVAAWSLWLAAPGQTARGLRWQTQNQSYLAETLRRLDDDGPHWIDFRAFRSQRRRDLREPGS